MPLIIDLVPDRHLPFSKGTGKSGLGYLFALPDDAGQVLIEKIEASEPLFLERTVTAEFVNKPDGETTRNALVAARLGQGKFREDLDKIWGVRCALSSLTRRELLRASHIKPWSASNNFERLDPYNGLLLSVGYDVAFDNLLITFDLNGNLISRQTFRQLKPMRLGSERMRVCGTSTRDISPTSRDIAPAFKKS